MPVTKKTAETDRRIREVFGRLEQEFRTKAAIEALAQDPVGNFLANEWIAACARAPALTVDEYARHLVELANQGRLPAYLFFELLGGTRLPPRADAEPHGRVSEELLEQLRSRLEIVISRDEAAKAALQRELAAQLVGKLVAIPTYTPEGDASYRSLALEPADALAFGAHSIFQSRRDPSGVANRLCRCGYRECRRFFIIDRNEVLASRKARQGRLRRDYCPDQPEHRKEEQRLKNAARQQRIRDRRAEEKAAAAKARKHK